MKEQMGNVSRRTEVLRESKGNARNQKHCNRNNNAFDGLISRHVGEEKNISELDNGAI